MRDLRSLTAVWAGSAVLVMALAGCSFTGAQELKQSGFLKSDADEPQGLEALPVEDAGSSPGSAA